MGLSELILTAFLTFGGGAIKHADPYSMLNHLPLIVQKVHIVSKQENEKVADLEPEFAVRGSKVQLYAVIEGTRNGKKVYVTVADSIKLKRKIPNPRLEKPSLLDLIRINWSKVEAEGLNTYFDNNGQLNNNITIPYANTEWKGGWVVEADVHPTILDDQFADDKTGLGTMRYMIFVNHKGRLYSTPGGDELTVVDGNRGDIMRARKRIEKGLAKVVYRNNEGLPTDYAFELFNTPYIWGSRPFDANQQIGSDCADLVVYARRRDGQVNHHKGKKQKYTWSYGLRSFTYHIITPVKVKGGVFIDEDGAQIPWGRVKPGDVVIQARHAGILYKDNGDGLFGPDDLWIDTIFREPRIGKVGYSAEVRRWK